MISMTSRWAIPQLQHCGKQPEFSAKPKILGLLFLDYLFFNYHKISKLVDIMYKS